jgi:hypothetical protein
MAKHAGSSVESGSNGSETLHPHSKSSASIAAGFRPKTPTKVTSDQNQETVHAGQKRPISDGDAETSRIKKARNDSIEKAMQHYKDNKPAIDYWWMSQQKSRRSPWFERFTSWKANGSLVPEPKLKADDPNPVPATLVQTIAMETPAEILQIRKQWGDLKPNLRKHPKDKANVASANWPAEDSIANSAKREDGMYNCLHVNGSFACCKRGGLDAKGKKRSIDKQIRGFKAKVEEMIVKKNLHIAHKTWTNWLNKKELEASYSAEMARIDALLTLVQGRAQPMRALAPVAPQATAQRQIPPPAATAFVPPAPQIENPRPLQQAGYTGPASQQLSKTVQQLFQMQQSGAVARPLGRPATQNQHKKQQISADASLQTHALMSAIPNSPVEANQQISSSSPCSARKQLIDEQLRLKAAYAIREQNGRNSWQQLVTIAGIDLSEESCRDKYDEVFQKNAAAVSSVASIVPLNNAQQQAPRKLQTPPPGITRHAQAQLPQLDLATNRAVESGPLSATMTPSPGTKIAGSFPSPSTPDTSFLMPSSYKSTPATSANYRQVAMKMFQQLIKDQEPIVLPGLKITREDFTTDMNGYTHRLAAALESQAEEATRQKTEEAARSGLEVAAQPGDRDDDFAMPDGIASDHDVLNYLFNDKADDAADEDKEYVRWHLPSSIADHVEALRMDLGAWDEYALPEFKMNPQFTCYDAFEDPLPPEGIIEQPQSTDLGYLDVPDNWFMDDPFEVIPSGPIEQWSTQPTYTLENLSYFDLDEIMPSDLQDRLRVIKDEPEQREAQGDA